ncbi:hypothetical protein ERO13_D06G077766v2 [Gossypium hirsutum]|uniref:Uncharacterized protein n=1 Tax=Gossypium tomentosum TaxID=34277 RepID=A0A5D2KG93_GOSTO|nr:hypothetical protein ERO13_D06G077766v2 [Gossypium hirsutum]TYH66097.1 hypothetical protein ES332_D06G099700v1 [Gossypium tomentosum]
MSRSRCKGQMITSLEKVVEWFALQTNVQGGQVYILIFPSDWQRIMFYSCSKIVSSIC